jgi:hypothetical protein
MLLANDSRISIRYEVTLVSVNLFGSLSRHRVISIANTQSSPVGRDGCYLSRRQYYGGTQCHRAM